MVKPKKVENCHKKKKKEEKKKERLWSKNFNVIVFIIIIMSQLAIPLSQERSKTTKQRVQPVTIELEYDLMANKFDFAGEIHVIYPSLQPPLQSQQNTLQRPTPQHSPTRGTVPSLHEGNLIVVSMADAVRFTLQQAPSTGWCSIRTRRIIRMAVPMAARISNLRKGKVSLFQFKLDW